VKRREKHRRATNRKPKPKKPTTEKRDWVPIEVPEGFDEMLGHWAQSDQPTVGWCLLCDRAIVSADDLIPGTSTHNCEAGRALEEKICIAEAARKAGQEITPDRCLRSSREKPAGQNLVAEPQVGIFFVYNGRLFIDSTPVSGGESHGNFIGHAAGHPAFWRALQRNGVVPTDVDYDSIPRGRVTYSAKKPEFYLFVDPCIGKDEAMLNRIERDMHLPSAATTVRLDSHYKCPDCRLKKTKKQLEEEELDWDF
jgi:hypothetical protein